MFDTNHKRKGLIGTILVHAVLLVLFIFIGMKYQDPPPEPGIAIVFGFDKQGRGDFTPVPKTSTKPVSQKKVEKEVIPEPVKEEVQAEKVDAPKEELMTQETVDSPIVAEQKRIKKEKDLAEKKRLDKEKIERERIEKQKAEEKRIKREQDAKKRKLDGMFSNLKSSPDASGSNANQGDDGVDGYKGSEDGSKNAKSFEGNGGIGNYGNYRLGNRKPKSKPEPIYDGTDQGIVFVKILVDKNGKVIYAEAGVKGSTTTDLQLLKRAKEAALKTTWQSDATAPEKQEGRIVYNFIIEN